MVVFFCGAVLTNAVLSEPVVGPPVFGDVAEGRGVGLLFSPENKNVTADSAETLLITYSTFMFVAMCVGVCCFSYPHNYCNTLNLSSATNIEENSHHFESKRFGKFH